MKPTFPLVVATRNVPIASLPLSPAAAIIISSTKAVPPARALLAHHFHTKKEKRKNGRKVKTQSDEC